MDALGWNIMAAAAGVGLVHVVTGPDHMVPFVVLARAQGWSAGKTALVTALCGVAHVASSLLLGGLGLALGWGLGRVTQWEALRGEVAGWILVAFGLAYAVWGTRKAFLHRHGVTLHAHNGQVHLHPQGAGPHVHRAPADSPVTFWSLFLLFAFGPCEPLIPLFMVPASGGRWDVAWAAGVVFSLVTLATMVAAVLLLRAGVYRLPLAGLERWSHALAGAAIAVSGLAVTLLGL
ncbi:MAG: hypothetical protein NZ869_10495 [Thermoanaerobaculum sp.]|nr:hypothetical protein [Thermoanaerobaculum sp.]MDW7968113.1 hypothetical protein [Thermoanaerobaculum sp.]